MKGNKIFLLLISLLGWFSVVAQLVLHMQLFPSNPGESIVRFFSFFTILTNLIVVVLVTVQCVIPENRQAGFFFKPSVVTACVVYITMVGVVYNIILRTLWSPTGLQAIVDDFLHTVIPVLMLIYWWRWVNTRGLQFRDIPSWIIYPVLYCIIVLIRGHFGNWYPYPFIDVTILGLTRALTNSLLLLITFLVFSGLFVYVGKRKGSLR